VGPLIQQGKDELMSIFNETTLEGSEPASGARSLPEQRGECIFSIDVEDWFHILDLPTTPDLGEWHSLPSRVENNFMKLLDLLSECDVRATCFFLGWVAENFPRLVLEASRRGHEIGSHGYSHRLVYKMTPEEFFQDLVISKQIVEGIVGRPVLGYRTSGFSVTEATPWFFEKIAEAGYSYDSSVFPARRSHGGLRTGKYAPYVVCTQGKELVEFPISVKEICGMPLCFFGGGYLRFFSYPIIRSMARAVLAEGRPVLFYVHPRELDPDHPRLEMNVVRRFKSYINLNTTEGKIRRLMSEFRLTTFADFMIRHRNSIGN
jgi:polysaccharide deacetylase family protein (PEP-CTERM system associated)